MLLISIECPRCNRYRTRMKLVTIELRARNVEKRMFECPKCHFIETKIATDPLSSDAITRLVDHVKPPG
jgi:transposase-like protein